MPTAEELGSDHFLDQTGVRTEADAMRETLKSSLQQRQNTVYARPERGNERAEFRSEFARLIRNECRRYVLPIPVPDDQHCEAIRRISDTLSSRFGIIFKDGRLQYGTTQKALNLYLKFLWRLGKVSPPPHCPVDGQVLRAAGIIGSWTHSDSEKEYAGWIKSLRAHAAGRSLAEWEYSIWRPELMPISYAKILRHKKNAPPSLVAITR